MGVIPPLNGPLKSTPWLGLTPTKYKQGNYGSLRQKAQSKTERITIKEKEIMVKKISQIKRSSNAST